jgi:hypothetical protein
MKPQGTTVTLTNGREVNHPDANTFMADEHNNLILLTNSNDDGLVVIYAAGMWDNAVSHGTHPEEES